MMYQCQGPALPRISAETAFNGHQVQRAREAVARSLGAHADEIMLNECCAVGINYVAMGLDWRKDDIVVLTEHEHPSNRIPWYSLAERWGVKIHILGQQPGVDQTNDAMLAELGLVLRTHGDHVRLVSASHVSRRSGARLPVAQICTATKRAVPTAYTLIDGAQVTFAPQRGPANTIETLVRRD
jgi:selenocysteine lyase/cysteine desulfurase